jgi:hypothetical protein
LQQGQVFTHANSLDSDKVESNTICLAHCLHPVAAIRRSPSMTSSSVASELPILFLHEVFEVDAFYAKMPANIWNLGRVFFV